MKTTGLRYLFIIVVVIGVGCGSKGERLEQDLSFPPEKMRVLEEEFQHNLDTDVRNEHRKKGT